MVSSAIATFLGASCKLQLCSTLFRPPPAHPLCQWSVVPLPSSIYSKWGKRARRLATGKRNARSSFFSLKGPSAGERGSSHPQKRLLARPSVRPSIAPRSSREMALPGIWKVTNRLREWARRRRRSGRYHRRTRPSERGSLKRDGSDGAGACTLWKLHEASEGNYLI